MRSMPPGPNSLRHILIASGIYLHTSTGHLICLVTVSKPHTILFLITCVFIHFINLILPDFCPHFYFLILSEIFKWAWF